jgi:hypothetical protein
VVLVGRREGPLREVAESIRTEGGDAEILPGDVVDPECAQRAASCAVDRFGGLDYLVNNAGCYVPARFMEEPPESFRRHFEVNVEGAAHFARACHPLLAERGGVVLNVLSTVAHRPAPMVASYAASKAALLSLTRSWALEWAADGIRSVAVAPGVVDTPIHDRQRLAEMGPAHPLGRVGRPEEIAAAVDFLLGPGSQWTTGAILDVDGGISLA